MNKAKIGIMVAAVIFLFVSCGYSQELSDKEREIFYEATWLGIEGDYQLGTDSSGAGAEEVATKIQQLLSQNNLSEDQIQDIMERGRQMPFTAAEEELAQEMNREMIDDLTPDGIMAALNNLADKYGMSIGQVSSVFTRRRVRE